MGDAHGRGLPEYRGSRTDRRSADRRAHRHGRHARLVLRAPLRFAQHLRIAARRRARRILPRAACDRRLRVAAALPAEHRHPDHALHDRGGRRRARRFHADRNGRGYRSSPHRADAARGAGRRCRSWPRSSRNSTTDARRTDRARRRPGREVRLGRPVAHPSSRRRPRVSRHPARGSHRS